MKEYFTQRGKPEYPRRDGTVADMVMEQQNGPYVQSRVCKEEKGISQRGNWWSDH